MFALRACAHYIFSPTRTPLPISYEDFLKNPIPLDIGFFFFIFHLCSMNLFVHIFIPHCNDIAAMDVVKTPYEADEVDDKCLVASVDDESKIFTLLRAAAEVRVAVLDYYSHSGSFLWHPKPEEEVYRVVTPDQSAIRQIHVFHDSNATNQYDYLGNCYRTEKEAEELLSIIKHVFRKYSLM